jgi:MFS family permease
MKPIILEFGIGHAPAGLLMSMVVVPGIFLAIPAGMLVDRFGVKFTAASSSILMALGCFVTAIAGSFEMALIGRMVLGVGGAFIVTAMPALIPQWFLQEELGVAMGIYGVSMPLASVIAFPLASSLMSAFGWRYLFYVATVIAIFNIFSLALLVKEGPLKHEGDRDLKLWPALRSFEMWKLGMVWLLFNASAISFTTWSPKIFQDFKNMNPVQASFLSTIFMLVSIPCVPLFGWFSDKIGRRRLLMVIGSTLMAVALTAIAYTSGNFMIALLVGMGIASAFVPPIVMMLPPEIVGPQLVGTAFGIITICLNTGIALAPPFIGFLIDTSGSQIPSFLGMALFSALGAVVAYALKIK